MLFLSFNLLTKKLFFLPPPHKIIFSLSDPGLVSMFKNEFEQFIVNDVDILIGNESEFNELSNSNEEALKKITDSNIINEISNIDQTSNSNETSAIANERIPKEEMVLKSSGNSWVEIEDLDGNSYLTRLMRSGETFVVPNKKGLTLSTGNAGVLSLTFGSIHISKLGSIGEVISSRPLNIEAFKER